MEYLSSLYEDVEPIGKLYLSIKEATISIQKGEFEEVKERLTSGIGNQHKKGGSSSGRFYRTRENDIDAFLKRIKEHIKKYTVVRWDVTGDKDTVKRFNIQYEYNIISDRYESQ